MGVVGSVASKIAMGWFMFTLGAAAFFEEVGLLDPIDV